MTRVGLSVLAVEPEGRYLDAGGIKIHLHDFGDDQDLAPILCLHGGGPGATAWSNFRGNYEALSEHHRTLLVDLPQYGRSEKVVIREGRQAFSARVIADLLDALGIEQANFVGNSMGGQIAIKLAIDAPEKVSSLVVIGSTPANSVLAPWPAEGVRLIRDYYKKPGPSEDRMRAVAEALVYDPSYVTEDLVRERYQASIDPEIVKLFSQNPPKREDLGPELGNVRAPALILWGQEDRAAAIDVGLQLLRAFKDAEMMVFPKCGHWVQVERREEFNHFVLDFFRRKANL